MSKKKMGKVLAAALCATTVATFYAAPVMAADLTSLNGNNKLTVNNNAITGVVDSDKKGSKNEFTINDQVTQFKTTVVQDSGRNKISSIRQNHEGVRLRAAEWTDGTATNGRFSDVLVTADSVKFGQGVNNPDITPNYTFTVDTKTGNLTAGTINGATIKGNSFNGAVIGGQKFNGVNVQELKAQVDGLNGNVATTNKNVAGIERTYTEDVLGQRDYTTTIEGTLSANDKGVSVGKDGKEVFHVSAVNGNVTGGLYNGVDVEKLQETTSKINEDTLGINRENGVTTIEGNVAIDQAGNLTATTVNGANITADSFNGAKINGTSFNGVVLNDRDIAAAGANFDFLSVAQDTVVAKEDGITVGKNGENKFHVDAATGDVTGGLYNGVNVEDLKADFDDLSGNVATTNKNVAGITRTTTTDPLFGQVTNTTTIEGVLDITSEGDIKLKNGSFAVDYNGNMTAANGAFKASQHGITVGDNAFHVDAATGNVTGGLYNGVDVKALSENVGSVNKNVAGIKRIGDEEQGYATVIEDKLQVGSDRMQVS